MAYHNHNPAYQHHHPAPQAPTYHTDYHAPPPTYPLKPIPHTTTAAAAATYTPLPPPPDATHARLASRDAKHKRRIRILKALSRCLATLLSLATFVPLALTLAKFFETRDQELVVDGETRTAWAAGTITWYTYLYAGVAGVSLLLNAAILAAYCCCCCCRGGGVRAANAAARVEGWWAALQHVVEVLVWVASVAIYRYGREPDVDGKFRDLWGWTCSPAAEEIQAQVTNIDFSTYCHVQVSVAVREGGWT